jgi:hypothetical protein
MLCWSLRARARSIAWRTSLHQSGRLRRTPAARAAAKEVQSACPRAGLLQLALTPICGVHTVRPDAGFIWWGHFSTSGPAGPSKLRVLSEFLVCLGFLVCFIHCYMLHQVIEFLLMSCSLDEHIKKLTNLIT